MICTSKTGVLVYGELAKEPEFKRLQNGSYLMKLNIRYDSEKNEAGKWRGKFIDVNIWRVDVDLWDDTTTARSGRQKSMSRPLKPSGIICWTTSKNTEQKALNTSG